MTVSPNVHMGPGATGLRRDLGPTAWTVLEQLFATARLVDDGDVVAEVSTRQLADALGLACGTVVRALQTIRRAGFAVPAQSRRRSGVFARCSYTLHVPADALAFTTRPLVTRAPRASSVPTEQLALLPE